MDTQTEELPITPAVPTETAVVVAGDVWHEFRTKLTPLEATAATLISEKEPTPAQQRLARSSRLELKKLRVEIDHKRLELVEDFKKKAKAIDGKARDFREIIEPLEDALLNVEEFAERQEAKRVAEYGETRKAEILAAGGNPDLYKDLGKMDSGDFGMMLEDIKSSVARRKEEERKVAEAVAAKAKAEAEERERIRVENERLRAESAAKEAALKAEREEAARKRREFEDAARKEREALAAAAKAEQEKREAQFKAEMDAAEAKRKAERAEALKKQEAERKEAEAKVQAAQEEARKAQEARAAAEKSAADKAAAQEAVRVQESQERAAAAKAPDRDKLIAFAVQLRGMQMPTLATEEGKAALAEIETQIAKFAAWVDKKAKGM